MCPTLKESRASGVIATIAITTTLALVAVIMRIASRRIAGAKLWADDYFIMMAMVVALGETANIAVMIHAGLGKHFVSLNVTQQVLWLKSFWILEFLYSWSMTLIKLAIVLFLRRVFAVERKMRITINVISVFLVLWFLAQVVYISVECRPLAKFWDYTITSGQCNSVNGHFNGYSLNGASLVLDLVIFVSAIPPLWGLKKSMAGRLSLIGIFCIGSLVCIAGAVRLPLIVNMDLDDLPWSATFPVIWLQIETKIGIVSACLPMLPPLFRLVGKSIKVPSFISNVHSALRSHLFKSSGTSTTQLSFVNEKACQGVGSSVGPKPRSAGSATVARFNSVDEGEDGRAELSEEEYKDWYSVVLRNISCSTKAEDYESSETIYDERRTQSVV